MKNIIKITFFLFCYSIFGQENKLETISLINQLIYDVAPTNYKNYYVLENSHKVPKVKDSINNLVIKYEKVRHNFPMDLLYKTNNEMIDWKNYNFKNVKYIAQEKVNQFLSSTTNVFFVKWNIKLSKFNNLILNKDPNTLIVKKRWFWSKKRIWNEIKKSWIINKETNFEQKTYYSFSKPIFSDEKKYSLISVLREKRCESILSTFIYGKKNGTWKKIVEYNEMKTITTSSHISCGDMAWVDIKKLKN